MAEVTNELMFEVLKKLQTDLTQIKDDLRVHSGEFKAIRGYMVAIQQDIHNIHDKLTGHELRLDRIERRLDLIGEPAQ